MDGDGKRTSGKVPLENTLQDQSQQVDSAPGKESDAAAMIDPAMVTTKQEIREYKGRRGIYMSKQVFPQAPSPTITSFRLSSAIMNTV